MLKYSPEEHKNLNLGPEDSEKMKNFSEKSEKILGDAVRGDVVDEAKEILMYASREKQDKENDGSDFYENIEKGSTDELFFRVLMEEIPNLGISIDEKTKFGDGTPAPYHVAIKTIPYKTDRVFISKLKDNPVVSFFTSPTLPSEGLGKELEEKGLLPSGDTERTIARYYKERIDSNKLFSESGGYRNMESNLEFWAEHLSKLGVEPLSDKEVRELLTKAIKEEYSKKTG